MTRSTAGVEAGGTAGAGAHLSVAPAHVGIGALVATLVVVVKNRLGAGDFGCAVVTTGYGIGMVPAGSSRTDDRRGRNSRACSASPRWWGTSWRPR
ncbi:hypothetical protein [Streptomyces caniferus]|uniref:hypothetical protein n=1 Tax=Streptomyces caniferus TaxID=285557 RepID=UPI00380B0A58